jgi:hypothetical protein
MLEEEVTLLEAIEMKCLGYSELYFCNTSCFVSSLPPKTMTECKHVCAVRRLGPCIFNIDLFAVLAGAKKIGLPPSLLPPSPTHASQSHSSGESLSKQQSLFGEFFRILFYLPTYLGSGV